MKMICLEHKEQTQTESTPGRDLAEHPGQESSGKALEQVEAGGGVNRFDELAVLR